MVVPPPASGVLDLVQPDSFLGLKEFLELSSQVLEERVTSRTVRLYATEGLIDRPGKDGRRAVYGQRHLLQLLLVRSFARRGLSLSAIAPLVLSSNQDLLEQWQQLVDGTAATTPPEAKNGALHYLQSISEPSSVPKDDSSALLPLLGSNLSSNSPSLRSTRAGSSSRSFSSRWHRLSLAPGVELHLSESASIPPPGTRREAWLQRLIDRVREQLDQP
jgi:DNA-binding transcriptional MerR regulator